MIEALKDFNDLLNRKPGHAIGYISNDGSSENKPDAAVTGKGSVEVLQEAIELALAENLDVEDIRITSVEPFDYGHSLEIRVSYTKDDEETADELYYITHAILY